MRTPDYLFQQQLDNNKLVERVEHLFAHCCDRVRPHLLATSATVTLAGKDLTVTRILMNVQVTPVKMEEPALTASMDLHVSALPSGPARSARLHSKVGNGPNIVFSLTNMTICFFLSSRDSCVFSFLYSMFSVVHTMAPNTTGTTFYD